MITLNIRMFLALFIAFVLSIIPLPEMMVGFRPPWILIVTLYIQFYLPSYFNVILLLFLGLCLDVLLSTVIGEHAFALLLTTWLATGKARRFNFFSMGQQMMLIAVFCLLYQLIIILVDAFLGYNVWPWMVVGTGLFSMLFWPWVRILGDRVIVRQHSSG